MRRVVLIFLLSVLFTDTVLAGQRFADTLVRIPYGKDGIIEYNLRSGTVSIFRNKDKVFTNISSLIKIEDRMISSADYPVREYRKTNIKDGFGNGEKHVVTLRGNSLPQMKQIFYTYSGRSFFLMETELTGAGLKTNRIIPFTGSFPAVGGDARTLFLPFDNDAFISYNSKPFKTAMSNISAEAGVVYDNNSRKGFVVGSLEHTTWKTGVRTASDKSGNNMIEVLAGYTEESLTRDKTAHGMIAGGTIRSPRIFAGYFDDWRSGMEDYGKANRIAEPPYVFNWTKPTPVGWNSWGAIQAKLSFDNLSSTVSFFADSVPGFRIGNTAYIDLDSYWDNLLNTGKQGDFSRLKEIASYCRSKGLEPGIYWGPFTDWGFGSGGDRKVDGSAFTYGELWTKTGNGYHDFDGARALDPTHPGTLQRIKYMMGKFKECGFKMIKIDFLGHAAIESTRFYDPAITTGMQAYRKGMEYLIDQAGGQMLIYAAISPSLATGRYAHTRRIACDAFSSLKDTRYTLNSLTYGWWQTYLYNFIDADHVVLGHESTGVNRARFLSSIITGTVITGDDFSTDGPWRSFAKTLYQDKSLLEIMKSGKAFRPVEGNTDMGASEMFVRRDGNDIYLAVLNYGNSPLKARMAFERLGLQAKVTYEAKELLQGGVTTLKDTFNAEISPSDAAIYKISVH